MLWFLLACTIPEPELLHLQFSRFDCAHACIGDQPMIVPAQYWNHFEHLEADYYGFSYAGMFLLAEEWDPLGGEEAQMDPMWGVGDPACDLVENIGEIHDWPPCSEPLPAYPPSAECY